MTKRITRVATFALSTFAGAAIAQSTADLTAVGTDNMLVHGMGYAAQRHSPLSQVNTGNGTSRTSRR